VTRCRHPIPPAGARAISESPVRIEFSMVMANQTRTSARAISESPVRIEFSSALDGCQRMVMANQTRTSAALLHLHRGPIKGPSATLRLGGRRPASDKMPHPAGSVAASGRRVNGSMDSTRISARRRSDQ